uniref:Uncharacterized protein n=1 Tax=Arundo donax TaxID=35708 RepID=A0A0A9BPI1_ARUDO
MIPCLGHLKMISCCNQVMAHIYHIY